MSLGVTDLDTAASYRRFTSHATLADIAGDLLPRFTLSTKVGYFPEGHDLSPQRLRTAVEQIVADLGRVPDAVLLHNPECSPDAFAPACETLEALRDEGLCSAWGVSTWDPRPLLGIPWEIPPTDVVMVRAGLSVPGEVLDASEAFARRCDARQLWGMAPFGGDAADPLWTTVDASLFLADRRAAGPLRAAFAAAFAMPAVARLAVGTSRSDHLAELVRVATLDVNAEMVQEYRSLLRARATVSR